MFEPCQMREIEPFRSGGGLATTIRQSEAIGRRGLSHKAGVWRRALLKVKVETPPSAPPTGVRAPVVFMRILFVHLSAQTKHWASARNDGTFETNARNLASLINARNFSPAYIHTTHPCPRYETQIGRLSVLCAHDRAARLTRLTNH